MFQKVTFYIQSFKVKNVNLSCEFSREWQSEFRWLTQIRSGTKSIPETQNAFPDHLFSEPSDIHRKLGLSRIYIWGRPKSSWPMNHGSIMDRPFLGWTRTFDSNLWFYGLWCITNVSIFERHLALHYFFGCLTEISDQSHVCFQIRSAGI